MSPIDTLLAEFDQEMAITRSLLERTPAQDAGWRPHPKSKPLGDLAVHVATIPWWATATLTTPEFDLATAAAPQSFSTVAALLAYFDRNVADARQALSNAVEADLTVPWTLRSGSTVFWTLPRGGVLRSLAFSHLIHHRAQLGVYLRLRDVPLPPSYGPTADSAN